MNFDDEIRLPRKLKKMAFGRNLKGNKLRKLIKSVVIIPSNNRHDSSEILPYPFCPKCGCQAVRWSGNKTVYPERWVSGYCQRCNYHVWESDNSPYYHALEMDDYSIF